MSPSRRAGTAVLVVAMVGPTAAAWLYFRAYAGSPWMPWLYAATKGLQFLLPVAWWRIAGPGSWRPSGRSRRPWRDGIGTGLLLAAGVLLGHQLLRSDPQLVAGAGARIGSRLQAFGADRLAAFLLLAACLALAHSFLEEYYWRWFVHGRLRGRLGAGAATVASSLAFAAHHLVVVAAFVGPGRAPLAVGLALLVAAAGAVWAWLYERSGGLLAPWVSHSLADVAVLGLGWALASGPR